MLCQIGRPVTVLNLVPPTHQDLPADPSTQLLDALVHARSTGHERNIAAAEQAIILEFLPQATRIALRQRGRGVEPEDLIQAARMGLVKAVRRWRPQPDGGFMQYAGPMMLGEVQRHIRDHSALVRLSRRVHDLRPAIINARITLERTGQKVTDEAVAQLAGVTVADVREDSVSRERTHPHSIDAIPDVADRAELRCERSDQEQALVEIRSALAAAISDLTERERRLLALRFFADRTQQEIADEIGLSQMQISRLLRGICTKLRSALETNEPARSPRAS